MGGAVRNVQMYLDGFRSDRFELVAAPTTVRQPGETRRTKVVRLANELQTVWTRRRGVHGIHIVGQYRNAIWREFANAVLAHQLGIPVLYHIKAGAFIRFWEEAPLHVRAMTRAVLRSARVVLCEGERYVDFLHDTFGIQSRWFPNFVPRSEIPEQVPTRLTGTTLRVLFVGFCYEGKGVFELLLGAMLAATRGVPLELTLIGAEEEAFTRFADARLGSAHPSLRVRRAGRLPHETVLEAYRTHDVFIMPTRHPGEGHTNSVNEAMMMGNVVVATHHGFLDSVLGDAGWFLPELSAEAIADALQGLWDDRDRGRSLALAGRDRLLARFTSDVTFPELEAAYADLTAS